MSAMVEDPNTLTKAFGFMTRFGKKMLVPDMFATVSLAAA
jgi:hypothetical protein